MQEYSIRLESNTKRQTARTKFKLYNNTIKTVSYTRCVCVHVFKYKTKIISGSWNIHCTRNQYTFEIIFERILRSSRVRSSDFETRTLSISWHRVSRRGSDRSG